MRLVALKYGNHNFRAVAKEKLQTEYKMDVPSTTDFKELHSEMKIEPITQEVDIFLDHFGSKIMKQPRICMRKNISCTSEVLKLTNLRMFIQV